MIFYSGQVVNHYGLCSRTWQSFCNQAPRRRGKGGRQRHRQRHHCQHHRCHQEDRAADLFKCGSFCPGLWVNAISLAFWMAFSSQAPKQHHSHRCHHDPYVGRQVCLSDVNSEVGEVTLVELRERFGDDKVAFIRFWVKNPTMIDHCEQCSLSIIIIFTAKLPSSLSSSGVMWRKKMTWSPFTIIARSISTPRWSSQIVSCNYHYDFEDDNEYSNNHAMILLLIMTIIIMATMTTIMVMM